MGGGTLRIYVNLSLIIIVLSGQLSFVFAHKSSIKDIDRQIKNLNHRARTAAEIQKKAVNQKKKADLNKKMATHQLENVLAQMSAVSQQLANISTKTEQTEQHLQLTKQQLQAAEQRIRSRTKVLNDRVSFMYTDGKVSYIQVLLASANFSDFLNRMSSLKMIVEQDQRLLDEHQKDKQLVVEKKNDLLHKQQQLKRLCAQTIHTKQKLKLKEKEKHTLIARYTIELQQSHALTEEQDKVLTQLVQARATLYQQKNKLRAQQAAAAARARAAANKRAMSKQPENMKQSGGGSFCWPVQGARLTSPFGIRYLRGRADMHTGIDLAIKPGTAICAAEAGVVTLAEWYSSYGYCVIIDHGGGLWTLYGHIREGGIKVSKGSNVTRGQKIAEVGCTGNSTGPHLHFEVRENGRPVNPMNYL